MLHQDCPALIIVEARSSWPAWDSPPGWNPTVLRQADEETPGLFAARIVSAFGELGCTPSLAMIVCSERTDADAERARRRLVGALLQHLPDSGQPRIVLASSDRASGAARRAIAELASDCNAGLPHAAVKVWFGAAPAFNAQAAA